MSTTTALNRRRFRFSLRTMLVGLTVFGGALGWFGLNVRRVQQRDEALQSGRVVMSGIGTYELNPKCRMLPYMWRWLGAQPYYFVELASDATPAELVRFRALFPDARIEVHEDYPESRYIHYSNIPEHVGVIGKLGQPLGQLATVRGTWMAVPAKPASTVFVIDEVDGRRLDAEAGFNELKPVWTSNTEFEAKTAGERWELRGVETGGFVGYSDEVWKELGQQQPASRPPRGFLTSFQYIKATRVEK